MADTAVYELTISSPN